MSINTVVLKNKYQDLLGSSHAVPFELSPGETVRFFSPTDRQSLSIKLNKQATREVSISAADGYIYLTNHRFVFLTRSRGDIDSFAVELAAAPLLQWSHQLVSPWFGANYWRFLFCSAAGASDGFAPNSWFEGQVRFNDGGVFDFVPIFDSVLNDAVNNRLVDEELPQYAP